MSRLLAHSHAVVLCGGRGSRLGMLTENLPKPLVRVHERPLLWYALLTLFRQGFRNFIFPLGYKGEQIEAYIAAEFGALNCNFTFADTGEDTPIAKRLDRIKDCIPDGGDFFLLNGDTFFDIDVVRMYQLHLRRNALLTLSSVEIQSKYGLIIEERGEIVDFTRDSRVAAMVLGSEDARQYGYVNAGLAWLNKRALDLIDLKACENFERELFPQIIRAGRAAHYKIEGSWFAVDTQKDLRTVNSDDADNQIGEIIEMAKKNLASRYSYKTRYYSDVDALRASILDKTVVPHQVEIQPGPMPGQPICWMKCPYCYGGSSVDSGDRLTPERYVDLMKQIAEGGVNKVIFAGYATDPLNYKYIEDLVEVARNYEQITGFHTKALRISERLRDLVVAANAAPLSYFSVSVDAGSNATYNQVHAVDSNAKLYDKVLGNLKQLVETRARNKAPVDLSATYLLNSLNNSTDEVIKAIRDLREVGIELIRFTFPQVPRGSTAKSLAQYVPQLDEINECMERISPIVSDMTSDDCQVLIMNLDEEYDTYHKPRTLPCFARFIYPSIGFDGHLAHCSESAAPHFRDMTLGNLGDRDFWDAFYDYDTGDLKAFLEASGETMCKTNCKCDRKEHVVNASISSDGFFKILDTAAS